MGQEVRREGPITALVSHRLLTSRRTFHFRKILARWSVGENGSHRLDVDEALGEG